MEPEKEMFFKHDCLYCHPELGCTNNEKHECKDCNDYINQTETLGKICQYALASEKSRLYLGLDGGHYQLHARNIGCDALALLAKIYPDYCKGVEPVCDRVIRGVLEIIDAKTCERAKMLRNSKVPVKEQIIML